MSSGDMSRDDEPAIIVATQAGDVARVAALLAADPATANVAGNAGMTPLHHAAIQGRLEIVTLLVTHGAALDVGEKNSHNRPLHYAVQHGKLPVMEALLTAGANANVQDSDFGYRPLHLAVFYGQTQHHRDTMIAAFGPAAENHFSLATARQLIRMLVAGGADPNLCTRIRRQSPLHLAAARNHAEAAITLLACGASRDVLDEEGRTAAAVAEQEGRAELAALLR